MRNLSLNDCASVGGGDTAPDCKSVAVKVTGSNGNSTIVYTTTCTCPEGTTMSTTTVGNKVSVTCKS